MILFASTGFKLDRKRKDGSTLREIAHSVLKQTKRWPATIPEERMLPEASSYLWDWYKDLARGRGSSGFGLSPLSWSDIDAWCRLTGVTLERWELEVLKRIDSAEQAEMGVAP